jgi:hypothetical protein
MIVRLVNDHGNGFEFQALNATDRTETYAGFRLAGIDASRLEL